MLMESARQDISVLLHAILRDAHLDLTFECVHNPPGPPPCLSVTFEGPDTPALLDHNGELLLALEHIATQALHLTTDRHDEISFDAGGFKLHREANLKRAAAYAVTQVRGSGRPFHFQPMSSRERRLMHLMLAGSGLRSESEGDAPRRHLVLHPKPQDG